MLTIDDIRPVPLFSTLADNELEHLANTSADLHLCAGEFAVHEGGERALYAVLAGKIAPVEDTVIVVSGGNVDPALHARITGG